MVDLGQGVGRFAGRRPDRPMREVRRSRSPIPGGGVARLGLHDFGQGCPPLAALVTIGPVPLCWPPTALT